MIARKVFSSDGKPEVNSQCRRGDCVAAPFGSHRYATSGLFSSCQCPFAFFGCPRGANHVVLSLFNVYSSKCLFFKMSIHPSLGLQDSASCFVKSMTLDKIHRFKGLQSTNIYFLLII